MSDTATDYELSHDYVLGYCEGTISGLLWNHKKLPKGARKSLLDLLELIVRSDRKNGREPSASTLKTLAQAGRVV